MTRMDDGGRGALHRYATITAGATFLLLIAGGLVTSTNSGLSVPDWPLSYGQVFPPMIGGIRYEHTHRMIAALVGMLIAILAGWLWRREPRRWVRMMGYAALGTVFAQALLGGLTVLWALPAPVSVAHACLGPLVFCLVAGIASVTSPAWTRRAAHPALHDPRLRRWSLLATLAFGLQLFLGAVIRHSGRGLMAHLVGAGLVVAATAGLWRLVRQRDDAWLRRLANVLMVGVMGQLGFGVLTLVSHQHAVVATAHVALGALLLAASWLVTVWIGGPCPRAADYVELTKPRLTALALLAAGAGFLMGSSGPLDVMRLGAFLLGAALVGGGANALNQWMERDADALMQRTRSRPLPTGRLTPAQALTCGLTLVVGGVLALGWWVNGLTAALAALTACLYVGLYTPMKRVTSLCTLIGAIPGAMPPLLGWAAARASVSLEAWVLFALLFVWQLPHFLAIALSHREEYARAGFRMLPVLDPDGASTARQILLYGLALLPISLLPTLLGATGAWYFFGAVALGVWFVGMAASMVRACSIAIARRVFLASIGYLPALLTLMVIDKTPV